MYTVHVYTLGFFRKVSGPATNSRKKNANTRKFNFISQLTIVLVWLAVLSALHRSLWCLKDQKTVFSPCHQLSDLMQWQLPIVKDLVTGWGANSWQRPLH
jgi:hypothetical protein